jgi:hypothetical protein
MTKAIVEAHVNDGDVDPALVLCKVFEACIHAAGRCHYFDVGLFGKHSPEGISHHVMIVAKKNTNSH